MTAFSSSQLPASVNSLEKLAVWLRNAIYDCAGATQVQFVDSLTNQLTIQQRVTKGQFRSADGKEYFSVTLFVPMDSDYNSGSAKVWTYAEEMSSLPIPATYNS